MPRIGKTKTLEIGIKENFGVKLEYAGMSGDGTFFIARHRDNTLDWLIRVPSNTRLSFPPNSKEIYISRHRYGVENVKPDYIILEYRGERKKLP